MKSYLCWFPCTLLLSSAWKRFYSSSIIIQGIFFYMGCFWLVAACKNVSLWNSFLTLLLRAWDLPSCLMMGTFLPSNSLQTPWPSANTTVSSRANTSCSSWQSEPDCIKTRVTGKQKEQAKVPSFLSFCLKAKIYMFWDFLPACKLQKVPRHPHNRVVRCFRCVSFRDYGDNKFFGTQ